MGREFAANIEQLKDLQSIYNTLISEVQSLLDVRSAAEAAAILPSNKVTLSKFLRPFFQVPSKGMQLG